MIFHGQLGPRGFVADNALAWTAAKQQLIGKRVTITLEREHQTRSSQQNRRFHVQCQAVAEILSVGRDLPISTDQAHYVLASAFLGTIETPIGPVPKKTSTLSVAAFNELMDAIDAYYAAAGTPLPTMEAP